jgi:hypothetical protein
MITFLYHLDNTTCIAQMHEGYMESNITKESSIISLDLGKNIMHTYILKN